MPCRSTAFRGLAERARTRLLSSGLCLLASATLACAREHDAVFLRSPAVGRPDTCPDDMVDVTGDSRGLGPTSVRCSYDHAAGGGLVQVRGKVLLEAGPGELAHPVANQVLTLHRRSDGKQVARTRTDHQGTYSLSFVNGGEELELRVVAADTREVLVRRRLDLAKDARSLAGIDLLMPVDQRLRP